MFDDELRVRLALVPAAHDAEADAHARPSP